MGAEECKVVDIHRELLLIEDELLYPEPARLIVFLSSSPDADVNLHTVTVKLDGSVVGRHRFDEAESRSLRSAGVHRAYIGIVQKGRHQIELQLEAQSDDGEDRNPSSMVQFSKGSGPLYFEFRVTSGSEKNGTIVEVNRW